MKEISFRNDVLPLKDQLFRLALRITLNSAEAEDVVQETMIKVWNRRDEWHRIDSIEAFCLTVCRNLALDKNKKTAAQGRGTDGTPGAEPADDSTASNPERRAMLADSVSLVRRLIDSLPEAQRSVMQLRDIEGKSYKEIAAVLGISEDRVKVTLFRARQAIRQRFNETERYGL